ncbi:MAG: hypothetical protein ACREVX_04150 [Clostridium sp.]|uniref:hypothetical protein n=1 Tax=Clostridium sp. TaxID=1506 RepID=UPI003D6CB3FF
MMIGLSPAVDVCKLLIERGASVTAFDLIVTTEYDFKAKTQGDLKYNLKYWRI